MAHEGMVDALTQTWRVLRPGGLLVDLRPIVCRPAVDVIGGQLARRAGRLDDSSDSADQAACERALEYALQVGLFRPQTRDEFGYSIYWDTPQEMLEYLTANWESIEIPEEVVLRAQQLADTAAPPVEVRVELTMAIASYEKPALSLWPFHK